MSRRHHDDAGPTDEVGATVAATDRTSGPSKRSPTAAASSCPPRWWFPAADPATKLPDVSVGANSPSSAPSLSPRDDTYVGSGRRSRIFHLTLACHLPPHSPLCRRTSSVPGPCRFSPRLSAPLSFPARAPFPRPLVGCLDRSENPAWRGASPIVACVQPAASPRVAVAVPPISRRCRP